MDGQKKRIEQNMKYTRIFVLVIMLALLLTSCNVESTPTAENSPTLDVVTPAPTPDVGEIATHETTPTSEEEISEETETTDNSPTNEPPTREPKYDEEKKAMLDELIPIIQIKCEKIGLSIDDFENVIKDAFEEYGDSFDERVKYEAVRTALFLYLDNSGNMNANNISLIGDVSFNQANEFYISKGGKALNKTDPIQNIAALVIATELFYQENFADWNDPVMDLGVSLGCAFNDGNHRAGFGSLFLQYYYVLTDNE